MSLNIMDDAFNNDSLTRLAIYYEGLVSTLPSETQVALIEFVDSLYSSFYKVSNKGLFESYVRCISVSSPEIIAALSELENKFRKIIYSPKTLDPSKVLILYFTKYSNIHKTDSCPDESKSSLDDYVVIDKRAISNVDIPDKIVIPIGHNRIRISTSLFVTLIGIIIAFIVSLSSSNVQQQKEQTQLLREILETMDASNSSQREYLEDIHSASQSQGESRDMCPPSTDNKTESSNTVSEN